VRVTDLLHRHHLVDALGEDHLMRRKAFLDLVRICLDVGVYGFEDVLMASSVVERIQHGLEW
jgi:predicted DNA-binding protein